MTLKRQPSFILHEYSHGFEIKSPTLLVSQWITLYAKRFVVPTLSQQQRNPHAQKYVEHDDRYFPSFMDAVFYRFHIGQLGEFIQVMADKGYPPESYTHIKYGFTDPVKIEFNTPEYKKVRPQQQDAIDFVLKSDPNGILSRLLQMPTGTGKTFTSLKIASILGVKFVVHVAGKYVDKWILDIQSNTDITEDEIYVIQGGPTLLKVMHLSTEEMSKIKAFVVSMETLGPYYKAYVRNGGSVENTPYPFPPELLHAHLGAGIAIFDEIHEKIYQVYRVLSMSHVQLALGLSGTFEAIVAEVLAVQKTMFPIFARYDDLKMNKYIDVFPIAYSFENFDRLNVQYRLRGSTMHNHNAYEQWILNRPKVLKNYLDMFGYIMHHLWYGDNDEYRKGDRSIVYVASIDLATEATEYFKKMYPDLDVRRYVQNDPYKNVLEPDQRISTPGSAGAAVDIDKLTMAYMSVSVQSPIINKQTLGRLREIKDRSMTYVYTYCTQIPQQRGYHEFKKKIFAPNVNSIKELILPFQL